MIRTSRLALGALGALATLAALALPLDAQSTATAKPAATRASRPSGPVKGATVEGITEYTLVNGLKVLLFPDPSKPTTTVNITYLVGSRHEGLGESGMAHLLEHMVFKGTPRHPDIPKELAAHGTIPNGTTFFDRTNYFETFSASDANLEWALDLEADRMVNSFIAKADLEKEFTVVRNEFEGRENSPFLSTFRHLLPTAYHAHGYGRDPIGNRSDIEGVKIENLKNFYRKFYRPDNAVLMIAGKFDEATALRLVHKYFSPLKRPNIPLLQTYTMEPTQEGERTVTIRRVGEAGMLGVFHHLTAGTHPDYAAASIVSDVLTDAPSGRLYKSLVETKKAASISAFPLQGREPGGMFWFVNVRKDDSMDSARVALDRTIAELASRPITQEELDRAKTSTLKEIELALTKSDQIGLELSEWMAMGDWRTYFIHRDRIEKLTLAEANRVAQQYFKPTNRTYAFFVPTDKPDRTEIPTVSIADVQQMGATYKGKATVARGEAFDPTPKNVEGRVQRTTIGGIKVALMPKKTRGETVNGTMTLRFGDEKTLAHKGTIASLTGAMLMRGTTQLTRQQLADTLDKLKARVSANQGLTGITVTFETTRANVPAVLALGKQVLRQPAFVASEFETLVRQRLQGIEQSKSEPSTQASVALNRALAPFPKGHPRYVMTPDEQIEAIKAVTLDSVKAFYAQYYGASAGEVAVVGDFEPAPMLAQLRDVIEGWPSKVAFKPIPNPVFPVQPANVKLETPDKAQAFFAAGLVMPMKDDHPDYPALFVANYILGGGVGLDNRLMGRLRQKEGLSYGAGSGLSASPMDERAQFAMSAIYAPQNLEKLEAAALEELRRAATEGFTKEEIDKAKSGYLQQAQIYRSQDAGLASDLANKLLYGRTFTYDETFEARIASLTPEQVTAAYKKWVDPSKLVIVKAGDFAKATKAATPTTP